MARCASSRCKGCDDADRRHCLAGRWPWGCRAAPRPAHKAPADCKGAECRDLEQLSKVMAESRDYAALEDAWNGWHTVSPQIRPLYERYVELA
ncbi:MAG: M2 family metallopeptidase, partial [Prosthecobacter sp.]